jgi:hypothetical protein
MTCWQQHHLLAGWLLQSLQLASMAAAVFSCGQFSNAASTALKKIASL